MDNQSVEGPDVGTEVVVGRRGGLVRRTVTLDNKRDSREKEGGLGGGMVGDAPLRRPEGSSSEERDLREGRMDPW